MELMYEATGRADNGTLDKATNYWLPDFFRYFVYTALSILTALALFFLLFKGYIVAIVLFLGIVFVLIEYRVAKKKIVNTVVKGIKELNNGEIKYHLYFSENKMSTISPPEKKGFIVAYSRLKKIVETKDLFILITDANLCIPIEKESLVPNEKYGWLDLICNNNKKIKLKGIK